MSDQAEGQVELKPCPFCGENSKIDTEAWDMRGFDYRVQCGKCGIKTLGHSSQDEAIKTWNRRATPSPALDREKVLKFIEQLIIQRSSELKELKIESDKKWTEGNLHACYEIRGHLNHGNFDEDLTAKPEEGVCQECGKMLGKKANHEEALLRKVQRDECLGHGTGQKGDAK